MIWLGQLTRKKNFGRLRHQQHYDPTNWKRERKNATIEKES